MVDVNLIFFGMPQSAPLVKELGKHYSSKDGFEVRFMSSVASISTMLETSPNGIFIFKVENKKDLTDAVGVLKSFRKLVKKGLLKPACISKVKSKKVDKILSKYGCLDILEPNITPKTLSFKIDFWSRSINTTLKKAQFANENMQVKSNSKVDSSGVKASQEDFVIVNSLDLQSDIWLLKSKADYKKILRRWLVRLLGPSPQAGNWIELEPQPGDKEPTWKYVVKKDDGQFILEDGAWFFYGTKPDFDWKAQRWIFSSNTPHLYFYSRSGEVYSRFKFVKGQLHIAKNSEFAQMKEDLILATCESRYEFQNEDSPEVASNKELGGNTDQLGGNLHGKTHTDQIDHDPLRGKSSTDELDGSPLEGRSKKNLDSQEKRDEANTAFTEDAIDGNLRGKSSTDQLDRSPLEGRTGNPLDSQEKRDEANKAFTEDAIDGNLRGKSSTDQLDRSPLEGRTGNPLDSQEKRDEANKAFAEDAIDGNLRGKSSTDQLDRSPLEGKTGNPLDSQEKRDEAKKAFTEEAIDGNLRGKSSTDQLDRSPLEGRTGNPLDSQEKRDEANKAFAEDAIDGNLRGKSSTDQLDRSPLESPQKNPLDKNDRNSSDLNANGDNTSSSEVNSPVAGKNIQNPLVAPIKEEFEDEEIAENTSKENKTSSKGSFKGSGVKEATQGDIKSSMDPFKRQMKAPPKQNIGTVANPFGGKRKRPDANIDFSDDLARLGQELPVIEDGVTRDSGNDERSDENNSPADIIEMPGAAPVVNQDQKEAELSDILGGGLTEGAYSDQLEDELSREIEELDEKRDFASIIGEEVEVNTESGEIKVVLKQNTVSGNHIAFLCQFDDLFEEELMVRAPKDSVNTKDKVTVSLTMKYNNKKIHVELEGKIIDVENDTNEPWDLLVVELKDIDHEKVDKLMVLYAERQESIHDFMNKAKGI